MAIENHGKVLLLTIGTGDVTRQPETLFAPLKKSISKGEWARVVLLPSQETLPAALKVSADVGLDAIGIAPLPAAGQENEPDACYTHFESVIAGLLAEGFRSENMTADFTRGTKAMSSALVLASVRHGLPRLRYVNGMRDERGMVRPGTERIFDASTATALGHRLLDQARAAFVRGNFAAVLDLLMDASNPLAAKLWPRDVVHVSNYARPLAAFYGAWDRLDYPEAARMAEALPKKSPRPDWGAFLPRPGATEFLRSLAEPLPEANIDRASRVRRIAADVFANGERRIRDRQYEDAILRAYRVLELIGQARIFARGYDSAQLPPDDPHVSRMREKLLKKGEGDFGQDRKTKNLQAPRELTARLLKDMGDTLAPQLLKDKWRMLTSRNRSILVHGYEATGMTDDARLREKYAELEALLLEDGGDEARRSLAIARSLDFSTLGA